ncbi:MAG: SRPBCC family protein [Eubacteriaceae bacterium]|nr:SRPBCC family protein [Eubacteriaceae bacterium]
MSVIKKSIFINAPLEKVYNYTTANPEEWSHFYVNLTGPEKLTGKGEAGTVGEFKYNMLGLHFDMTIEVVESKIAAERALWIGNFKGPIFGTQRSIYVPKDGGTELTIEIESTRPESILKRIANSLIVDRMQENALVHTLENIKTVCEGE